MKFKLLSILICLLMFSPVNVKAYDTHQIEGQSLDDLMTPEIKDEEETPIENTQTKPSVQYSTHVQNIGWQETKQDGEISGTFGKSYRLEAIQIQLNSNEYTGGIQYCTHIQNIGWQDWKRDGDISGTYGRSLRLEAIRISLTGEIANHYDIYYRVHAQNFGWLDWAKNGEDAGTAGYSYRLEAIEIKVVSKNEQAPGNTNRPFIQKYVEYSTHIQNIGWQDYRYDGYFSGTTGKSLRLEAIKIKLSNPLYKGSIEYRTHIQDIGWENSWKRDQQISGTSGQSKRLEAIQIRLTDEMAMHYDIYYRVHAQNFGWLDWAKNGESAGTEGYSYRLEAIEIKLVLKGNGAPGPTNHSYYKYNSWVSNLKVSKTTSQLIVVSVTSGNYANVSMHDKLSDGTWRDKFNVSGRIGKNGLNKTKEGDGKTPVGIYSLTQAFGVASNPGCTRPYLKLNTNHYWVDDSNSRYYNKLVDKSQTGIQWKSAEHLIKYSVAYEYAIALDFNSNCIPGKGSAIFLHCSTSGPTAGCISIPRAQMQYVLQNLKSDTKIIIDYQSNISKY